MLTLYIIHIDRGCDSFAVWFRANDSWISSFKSKNSLDLRFIIKCSKEPTRSWPELRSNVCLTIIVFIKNNHPCVCILKRTIIDLLWNPTKELPIHADHGNSFVMTFLCQNFMIFLFEGVVNLPFWKKKYLTRVWFTAIHSVLFWTFWIR